MLFPMPAYPAVPAGHEAFWAGIIAALEAAVEAFQTRGILHSLDVINEPEIARDTIDFAALGISPHPQVAAEFWSNVSQDAFTRSIEKELRYKALVEWALAAAADIAPGVPRTVGHVGPFWPSSVYKSLPAGGYGVPAPEFISGHSYGHGRYVREELEGSIAANQAVPEIASKDFVYTEFYRCEPGDTHLLDYLYELQEHGVGAVVWDLIAWPNFGGDQQADYPPNGAPDDAAYPTTGIARSYDVDGAPQVFVRRPDLVAPVRNWAGGLRVEAPRRWGIRRAGRLTFSLWETTYDNPLAADSQLVAYWRWAYMPRASVPSTASAAWMTTAPWNYFLAAGAWLDIPGGETVFGSPHFVHPNEAEAAARFAAGDVLVVQALFGRRPYNLLEWEQLQHETTDFLVVDASALTEPPRSWRTLLFAEQVLDIAQGYPFTPLTFDPTTGRETPDLSRAVAPSSATFNEISGAFSPSRSMRSVAAIKTGAGYLLRLQFSEKVLLEDFEDRISVIQVPAIDNQPGGTLQLVSSNIVHPPQADASSGTAASYSFTSSLLG
jgi:hypothetical protein